MQTRKKEIFTTIKTEGALLPSDLLQRIADGDKNLPGLSSADYHLTPDQKLNEAINHSWNHLIGCWKSFHYALSKLPENDPATTITRERWLLPLFQELGYGRLQTSRSFEIEGKSYPISHIWKNTPIHLISCRLNLDQRTPRAVGAARFTPHGLVQEFLNRSEEHVWGFLSNGNHLRILRDNVSLSRQSYVEFDLFSMMEGDIYSDFALLWLLCHESRVEADRPSECFLEKWSHQAQDEGTRALDQLRNGVEEAIKNIGSGFLSHPSNTRLLEKLRTGHLDKQDYYRQLLRLVYRLLFLFVAEDRDLLNIPNATIEAKERYIRYYSTQRLRNLARRIRGTRHSDLWESLILVMKYLHKEGCQALALPALGGFLWSDEAISDLVPCRIENNSLLSVVRALAFIEDKKTLRPVDFKNLRSEELGSIYESLLELHPELNPDAATFDLRTSAGNERKTTGSYYTPDSLVQCLLDSALEPIINEARKKDNPEQAILDLKVCDPACGSGHFLIAAAHRMAKRLASIRTGDEEPSPEATRTALRDIVGRCLYGVDINPMAVELCKVALWMEAIEPGKPLSFLDHHIQCGNSLIGTTPELLSRGIPNAAFEPIEGDDNKYCSLLKKHNKEERQGQDDLFTLHAVPWNQMNGVQDEISHIQDIPDDNLSGIEKRQEQWRQIINSDRYKSSRLIADAWCAAFIWKKTDDSNHPHPITQQFFNRIMKDAGQIPDGHYQEIRRLAEQYKFFHWHLAFPDIFLKKSNLGADPKTPSHLFGFDAVLGNPPWERIKLQEKEWFVERDSKIANASNASIRKRLIEALKACDSALYQQFLDDMRKSEGESHLIRNSGLYPLCGRGDINTYAVFAEGMRALLNYNGRVGCVLPTGIATDDTTKFFFQNIVEKNSLISLYSFENEEFIFPNIHHATRFCLFTIGSGMKSIIEESDFMFFARKADHLHDPERHFRLSTDDIALLNPNTRTCPIFRSRRDAELTKHIYRRVPVLIREAQENRPEENPWGIKFFTMFHMSNDSHLFHTREQLEAEGWNLEGNILRKSNETYLPLYEAKMIHHFDHRWGTYKGQTDAQANQGKLPELTLTQHADPSFLALPANWIRDAEISRRIINSFNCRWFIGFRGITGATVLRTVISCVVPYAAFGNSLPLIQLDKSLISIGGLLTASLNSFVLDFCARFKVGGSNLNFFILEQFSVLPPSVFEKPCMWSDRKNTNRGWLLPRVLELTYTAWDLEPFARDCGWSGPPFLWDEERRFLIRCELDAAFFHLYLGPEDEWRQQLEALTQAFPTPRHAVAYIMDTFPIVKRKDEAAYGNYRTRDTILEIYDAMQTAIITGVSYQTRLDPPPAHPSLCHPQREITNVKG